MNIDIAGRWMVVVVSVILSAIALLVYDLSNRVGTDEHVIKAIEDQLTRLEGKPQ